MSRPSEMERRVYDMPADLMRLVKEYQVRHRLSSEVEAVRRLVAYGIAAQETAAHLLNRLQAEWKRSRDFRLLSQMLSAHPKVQGIKKTDAMLEFDFEGRVQGWFSAGGEYGLTNPRPEAA